jgi:hypothetical protein
MSREIQMSNYDIPAGSQQLHRKVRKCEKIVTCASAHKNGHLVEALGCGLQMLWITLLFSKTESLTRIRQCSLILEVPPCLRRSVFPLLVCFELIAGEEFSSTACGLRAGRPKSSPIRPSLWAGIRHWRD